MTISFEIPQEIEARSAQTEQSSSARQGRHSSSSCSREHAITQHSLEKRWGLTTMKPMVSSSDTAWDTT